MENSKRSIINKFGFFITGFTTSICLNTVYSAALDFMTAFASQDKSSPHLIVGNNSSINIQIQNNLTLIDHNNYTNNLPPFCQSGSTSLILMAISFPLMVLKLIFPLFMTDLPDQVNVALYILILALGYLLMGLGKSEYVVMIGIALVSIGIGISDPTTLSLTHSYGIRCLGGYVLGSIIGAFATSFMYALLRMYVSLNDVMFIILTMPFLAFISYAFIIRRLETGSKQEKIRLVYSKNHKTNTEQSGYDADSDDDFEIRQQYSSRESDFVGIDDDVKRATDNGQVSNQHKLSLFGKIKVCRQVFFYFFPLFISYSIIFYTNQGLYELIDIRNNGLGLNSASQYRWYQFAYQFGGIIGRMFGEYIFRSRNLWIHPITLVVSLIIMLLQVFLVIQIPYISIMFLITFAQGFMVNHCYISMLYKVTDDFNDERIISVALTAASTADITSALIPAFLGSPTHTAVCDLYKS